MSEIDLLIAECENFITNRGIDDGVISAYCGISQMASNEKQIEKIKEVEQRLANIVNEVAKRLQNSGVEYLNKTL